MKDYKVNIEVPQRLAVEITNYLLSKPMAEVMNLVYGLQQCKEIKEDMVEDDN